MSTLGSSLDILSRVRRLIPRGWFQWGAPVRDAIIGGIADSAAWNYTLIGYAKAQTRLATAYGPWLDVFCFDFLGPTLTRSGAQDDAFRALILATILQERVTRAGMVSAITKLTGNAPRIFEPWNTGDTGAYSNLTQGKVFGQFGYGIGQGGYGSMQLPAQTFMWITRGTPSGVPDVDGYGGYSGGYGVGAVEYISNKTKLIGVTDEMIDTLINLTKPVGSLVWTAFNSEGETSILTSEDGDILVDENQNQLTTG